VYKGFGVMYKEFGVLRGNVRGDARAELVWVEHVTRHTSHVTRHLLTRF